MRSCDTNILLYSLNRDCGEHRAAVAYMEQVAEAGDFAICELVLVELYLLLRTPAVLSRPLGAIEAWKVVNRYRTNPHWQVIDYPGSLMRRIWERAGSQDFPRRAIFDARLALTLRHHGVKEFATRNVNHFRGYGFMKVVNPIDGGSGLGRAGQGKI